MWFCLRLYYSAHVEPTSIKIPFRVDQPFFMALMAESNDSDNQQKMLFLGNINHVTENIYVDEDDIDVELE